MPPTTTEDAASNGLAGRHECGLFAAVALSGTDGPDVVPTVLAGLRGLQHRGQQSAGIVVRGRTGDGAGRLHRFARLGLVGELADEGIPAATAAIGHVRYATFGSQGDEGIQPVTAGTLGFAFAGHVAGWTRAGEAWAPEPGASDARLLARLIHRELPVLGLQGAVYRLLADVDGAVNLLALTAAGELIAARDRHGFRPLHWMIVGAGRAAVLLVSSEDHVLRALGEVPTELAAGELIGVDRGRVRVRRGPRQRPAACSFELVYFAHPAASFEGRTVHAVRERLGFELADEETVRAERALVVPVPATGAVAARAYAQRRGVPVQEGVVTDRYHARTFIGQRPGGAPAKHHVVPGCAHDMDAFLVDDSLVRGSTLRRLVGTFRRVGQPRSVHVRLAAPPVLHPCFYGIDVPDRSLLPAARLGLDDPVGVEDRLGELAAELGADSVRFLSLPGFRRALAPGADGFCYACLTGDYPTPAGQALADAGDSGRHPRGRPIRGSLSPVGEAPLAAVAGRGRGPAA